jgi:hypothetical protein
MGFDEAFVERQSTTTTTTTTTAASRQYEIGERRSLPMLPVPMLDFNPLALAPVLEQPVSLALTLILDTWDR